MRADALARAYRRALAGASSGDRRHGVNGPESAAERVIAPYADRVARLTDAVKTKQRDVSRILAVLDRLPFGVLLVDSDRRIHAVNRQGLVALADNAALRIHKGRLAVAPNVKGAIDLLLATTSPEPDGFPLRAARVSLASRGALWLVAWRLIRASPFGPRSLFVVLLSDGRSLEPSHIVLRRCFGLTPGESRVAALMAAGRDSADVARTLGISRNGVRFHVKNVLNKLTVGRQSELVRVLLASPAGLHEP